MSGEPELLPIGTAQQTSSFVGSMLAADRTAALTTAAAFILAGAAGAVPPYVIGTITDDVRAGHNTIAASALVIASTTLAASLLGGVAVSMLARVGEPALARLREQVLSRALHLPTERIERSTTGDLLSRLSDDVQTVSTGLKGLVPVIANAVIAVAFSFIGVLTLDWRLGLAMLCAAPLYLRGLRWYLPRARPLYREQRIAQGDRAEALLSGVYGAPTARAFGLGAELERLIEKSSNRAAAVSVAVYRLTLRFLNRNNLAEFTGLCMVLGVGFVLVHGRATTVGAVTAAALYFLRLFTPVGSLMFTFDQFQAISAALSRLVGIALLPPATVPESAAVAGPPEIVLAGISHEYTPGKPVLHDVTLRIAAGEQVALVGATGAGKTTLGAIAAGVLHPTRGQVLASGAPQRPASTAASARVFLVTQESDAPTGTVRDFLTFAKPQAVDEDIRRALAGTFADLWVDALPDGLDTVIGEGGHQLAPDQVQHLALARVMLGDPWFVVLDEATAQAGSAGAHLLERAAAAAMEGRTALVVAHRLSQARLADRILVMNDGVIIEEGTHDQLLALGGSYNELWRAWSGDGSE